MNADDDTLAEYLAQALADQEAGLPLDLAALCGDRPDLVPAVAAALGLSSDLPALHRTSLATDAAVTGTLAGRYTLQAAIGRGASGTVYRARDERLQREVAVKLLHRGLFASDEAEARFQREAVALAAHEHAHIVRVHDQGQTEDGTTFLVTELLRGLPLQAVLDAAIEALPMLSRRGGRVREAATPRTATGVLEGLTEGILSRNWPFRFWPLPARRRPDRPERAFARSGRPASAPRATRQYIQRPPGASAQTLRLRARLLAAGRLSLPFHTALFRADCSPAPLQKR